MKIIPYAILLVLSTTSLAEVIWEPAKYCATSQFGVWSGCSGKGVPALKADQVTTTELEFLKSLPIENTISYDFKCSASRQFNVGFAYGTQNFPLFWNVADKFKNTYYYSEQSGVTYSLLFTPPTTSTSFRDACTISIVSNLTIPDIKVLTSIVDNQKTLYSDLLELEKSLSKASELPAKWSALNVSKKTIEGSASLLDFEREQLEIELAELQSVSPEELTQEERDRMTDLPNIIESFASISKDLRTVENDIASTLKVAAKCGTDTPDAFCLTAVENVITSIKGKSQSKKTDLEDLATFLNAESTRLKDSAQRLSKQLAKLAPVTE